MGSSENSVEKNMISIITQPDRGSGGGGLKQDQKSSLKTLRTIQRQSHPNHSTKRSKKKENLNHILESNREKMLQIYQDQIMQSTSAKASQTNL